MKRDEQSISEGRRGFLRGVAGTGAAAAVVAAVPVTAAAGPAEEAAPADPKTGSKGYHVTRHVADYYRTIRS